MVSVDDEQMADEDHIFMFYSLDIHCPIGNSAKEVKDAIFNQNSDSILCSKDIYNVKEAIKKRKMAGRNAIMTLLDDFDKNDDVVYDFRLDPHGHTTHLFTATQQQIQMARERKTVFLLDCTYKTNRYKLPLLNITLITDIQSSFVCALAFLAKEDVESYTWALQTFAKFFTGLDPPEVRIHVRLKLALY